MSSLRVVSINNNFSKHKIQTHSLFSHFNIIIFKASYALLGYSFLNNLGGKVLKKRRSGFLNIKGNDFIKPDFIVSFISEPIGEGSVLSDFLGESFF